MRRGEDGREWGGHGRQQERGRKNRRKGRYKERESTEKKKRRAEEERDGLNKGRRWRGREKKSGEKGVKGTETEVRRRGESE